MSSTKYFPDNSIDSSYLSAAPKTQDNYVTDSLFGKQPFQLWEDNI